MATKTGKKITGGKYISRRKKKSYEIKGHLRIIKVGELKRKSKRTRGGNQKNFVLSIEEINVRTDKGIQKTKVKAPKEVRSRINQVTERDAYYYIDDVTIVPVYEDTIPSNSIKEIKESVYTSL